MKNIIRAQLFQARHTNVLRTIFIGFSVMTVLFALAIWGNGGREHLRGSEICAMLFSIISTFMMMLMVIVTAIVCGNDLSDRTINHELSSGTLRRDAFFGRAIPSLSVALFFTMAQYIIMYVTAVLLSDEWGYEITAAGLLQRILLTIPIFLRIGSFYIFVCCIIKKPAAVVGIYYGLLVLENIAKGETPVKYSNLLTGLSSMSTINNMHYFYTFALHGENRMISEPFVAAGDAVQITAVSLIMTAVYLILGYSFFRRDDLR
ncbi:ABC-2 family transporter protein [Ruminococcus sp. YE71]|uniref:ABC transporter permease subunit n=1 Tax=unclassified Ruminococcus TaxID=2608920 RepID=UPI0008809256|nr:MULTISPECIES: ABC transporter permease subunit [unclassified Ruminococcus]SDA21923.1 ABC-2 family transporter protein [Ruminococcus sp. YE78]SFW37145.1 ABC-2 family transporter protein [Ruminococcus sp. YE71]